METPYARLRAERLRIGISQEEFAAVGGVGRGAQRRYEAGDREPDMKYLGAVHAIGVDVLYVLTGHRALDTDGQAKHLALDERNLLEDFRKMNDAGKASVQAFVSTCLSAPSLTSDGQPQRVRRLTENRRTALDERTNENIDRAMELVKLSREEREAASPSGKGTDGPSTQGPGKRAKRGVENRRADLGQRAADVVDLAVNMRKSSRNTNETPKK
ncbi:transcriptional regulator with XRE-family HTH domain [Robbsia andropogonis]|uniref:helix-turn-helix domain-containing protein n=1 Tax=Robbsia andropogonis TaxID=28092 RepID=UPI003D22AE1C